MPKNRSLDKGGGVIFLIVIVFIALIIINAAGKSLSKSDDTITTKTDTTAEVAKTRQAIIDRFAPSYCEKKQKTKVSLTSNGKDNGWPSNDGSGWTNEECVTIISKLHDSGATENELEIVIKGNYAIGMLEMSLLYSLGSPTDINRTHLSNYTTAQYVYGDPLYNATYIYTENGKVTSVQN